MLHQTCTGATWGMKNTTVHYNPSATTRADVYAWKEHEKGKPDSSVSHATLANEAMPLRFVTSYLRLLFR